MPIPNLSNIEYQLGKRGFRLMNTIPEFCVACSRQAVARWVIKGATGGRDIDLCQDCGHGRSWRTGRGLPEREIDATFDLMTFLAM